MKLFSNRYIKKLSLWFRSDHVVYNGKPLPANHLRTGGVEFKDDAYFLQSAHQETQRLIDHFGYTKNTSILDIGCGFGRLPIGILDVLGAAEYTGIDVNPIAIEWCQKHIGKSHKGFNFIEMNVQNDRYNPSGLPLNEDFQFEFSDNTFEVAYLYSVFSHMVSEDLRIYLKDLNRILTDRGRVFFTAFAEEDVPNMEINPKDYGDFPWSAALHCVRFNLHYLDSILQSAGFKIDHFEHGHETNGQSAFYLSKI